MPDRARFLHPTAAASFLKLPLDMQVSDMLRSAASSMAAVEAGRGAQPPGRSGHNYGLAIDVDLDYVLKRNRLTKKALNSVMNQYGWYCHRKDHELGHEAWHYNFFGHDGTCLRACDDSRTTERGMEHRIQQLYGTQMVLSPEDIQSALAKLKLYDGTIDGKLGPVSKAAINMFQRMVMLPPGPPNAETQRRLAFVTATRHLVPVG